MQGQIFKGISGQLHSARHNYLNLHVQKSPTSAPVSVLQSCGENTLKTEEVHQISVSGGSWFHLIALTKMPAITEGGSILAHS